MTEYLTHSTPFTGRTTGRAAGRPHELGPSYLAAGFAPAADVWLGPAHLEQNLEKGSDPVSKPPCTPTNKVGGPR